MNDDRRLYRGLSSYRSHQCGGFAREIRAQGAYLHTASVVGEAAPRGLQGGSIWRIGAPAARFVPEGATDEKKKSLGRANAAKFVERLCEYPGNPTAIAEAQRHILEAHAERLTCETGKKVTVEDIVAGRAPRPRED